MSLMNEYLLFFIHIKNKLFIYNKSLIYKLFDHGEPGFLGFRGRLSIEPLNIIFWHVISALYRIFTDMKHEKVPTT